MVLYKCNKCNKEFNRKSNYINHINRKFPCNNLVIENILLNESSVTEKQLYKCETCHKKSNYTKSDNEIVSELKNYKNEYFNLLVKYEELQNKFIDLNKNNIINNTTNNNNIINNNTNNIINITLTNFGNDPRKKIALASSRRTDEPLDEDDEDNEDDDDDEDYKYTKLTNDEQCIANLIKFLDINDFLQD